MGLRDTAVNYLRSVFGRDREDREAALSPSSEAEKHLPSSLTATWGREDIGGLLSVSQNLMDIFADNEQMNDYPDINCFAEGSLVLVTDGSLVKPVPIDKLAFDDATENILAYDRDKAKIVKVSGQSPRLTGICSPVIKIPLSNGTALRVTKNHKILHKDRGYVDAETLKLGDELVGMSPGFNPTQMGFLTHHKTGYVTVTDNPTPDGTCRVFDITTSTHNLIINGVVCHNSAIHYFANDATQPDIDTGRTIWVSSNNEALKESSDVLLRKRLRMEDEIWSIAYTLSQHGNDYEELLVTENGVVGLNFLPVPTIRRIERGDGALVGYVQDVTGKFTEDAKNLRAYLAGKGQVPDHVAVFEDWQVCHMRTRGTHRRSPYGRSLVTDGSRWIWKRLVILEDAALIYRLVRSPARFAFYIDVTDIPSDRVEQFLRRTKQELKKKSLINPRTQQLDMRYSPLCLAGDTKIPLLDGSEKTILEMISDYNNGNQNWTYSIDTEQGNKLVPGKVVWAGKTRENAQLVKITLDNGESLKVTPDHKMMLRNGEYIEAKNLKSGDSMMPLYRKTDTSGTKLGGYEMVYNPATDNYQHTHRLVARHSGLYENRESSWIIHHKNFNKLDNSPENLSGMTHADHSRLHSKAEHFGGKVVAELRKKDKDNRMRAIASRNIMQYNKSHDSSKYIKVYNSSDKHAQDNEIRRRVNIDRWKDSELKENYKKAMTIKFPEEFISNIKQLVIENPTMSLHNLAKIMTNSDIILSLRKENPGRKLKSVYGDMITRALRSDGWKNFADFRKSQGLTLKNHKVVCVEFLKEQEDTYCITVEKFHNFATSCGVVVKNSSDEDVFFGVRDGKNLARAETLSGPNYQTMDDVDYFKRMLHGTLKVPRSYLGQDGPIPGKSILCLTGDTKIPLLDGTTKTMEELASEYKDKDFYVYSINEEGHITSGRGHSPQMTRPNAEILELTLDNGKTIKGTPDHPFMMRDGSYRQLQELKPGDSLMPIYRKDSVESKDGLDGYEMILDPSNEKWKFTHRVVATAKWNRTFKLDGRVIHHTDFNKRNNDPRNLSDPLKEEHFQIHRDHCDRILRRPDVVAKSIKNAAWWVQSEENKQQCRDNLEKARAPGGGQNEWCKSREHKVLRSKQMTEQWSEEGSKLRKRTQTPEFRKAFSEKSKEWHRSGKLKVKGKDNATYRHDASYEELVKASKEYSCKSFKDLKKQTGYSSSLIYRLLEEVDKTYEEFANEFLGGYRPSPRGKKIRINHKVVSIKPVGYADCYDFVVDEHHNYAVDGGIFVHNSNEDVRSARVTLALQRELRNGMAKIIRIDQAARGLDPWKHEFEVHMTVPSGIYELAQMEVRNARADFATRFMPFVSMQWVRKHVFKLSDDEIKEIDKQADKEQQRQLEIQLQGQKGMMDIQLQAQQAAATQQGGLDQGLAGNQPPMPEPMMTTGTDLPRTQLDWKHYDATKRLEEKREKETDKRLDELEDSFNTLLVKDKVFAHKIKNSQMLLNDIRDAGIVNRNGYISSIPPGRGHKK